MPIERKQESDGHWGSFWRVTISDTNGQVLFKDDSRFVGNLNVYWRWDEQDRVWLRNSDTGNIYYWEMDSTNVWHRHLWEKNQNDSLSPPAGLRRTP